MALENVWKNRTFGRPRRPVRRSPAALERLEERALLSAYTLQILHASDAEAGLPTIDDAPRFAAIVDALEDTYANTIIVSGGDNFLPGPFFNAGGDPALSAVLGSASIGRADIEVMNRIGFEVSAMGNHEFDLGTREIANLFFPAGAWRGGQFPYLTANVNFASEPDLNGRLSPGGQEASSIRGRIAPSAIITEGGEKIGFVGLTTPEILSISSPGPNVVVTPGSGTYDYAALASVVNATVDQLEAQGVNKVILLSHLQQFQNEVNLAPLLRGVDVVVAAGSNTISADATDRLRSDDLGRVTQVYPRVLNTAEGLPVLVVSTDAGYRYLGRMVVSFDTTGVLSTDALGRYLDPAVTGAYATDAQGVTDVYASLGLDPATALTQGKGAAVAQVTDAIRSVIAAKDGNRFGRTSVFLEGRRVNVRTQETNLGNLTADANLFAARAITGDATIGISLKNGGGIRDSIGSFSVAGDPLPTAPNPGVGKAAGDVSQLDIENSLRFNNGLSVVSLDGVELRRLLEHGFAASGPGQTQGRFPQIGGMTVEVDLTKPAGGRLVTLIARDVTGAAVTVVKNGTLVAPAASFRMATLGFLASGGDGYPFSTLSSPQRVDLAAATGNAFTTTGPEQDALADYLAATYPVGGPAAFGQAETPAGSDLRIRQIVVPTGDPTLAPISTVSVPGGAEISAFDPASKKLFVTKNNGGVPSLDVIDLSNPASPGVPVNVDLSAFGASVSSVAVKNGIVAAAMIAGPKTAPSKVVFLSTAGAVLGSVTVGSVPDMITFTPDGSRVLVAIEGEAADNTFPTVDNPEGGVSIIALNKSNVGGGSLSASAVTFAGFSAFNGQKDALRASGVRLLTNPAVTVAMDLEPEYIAIAPDGGTARVTLQEANAVGVLDLVTNTFTAVLPLGLKDYGLSGNEIDASDRDGAGTGGSSLRIPGNFRSWPVFGVYMPDAIASFEVNGQTYYVTANEGDARPNAGDTADTDVTRVGSLNLDDALFPNETALKNEDNLGRLNVLTAPGDGDVDGDGDIDRLLSLGGRSFTIWDSAGNKIYDSGSDLERRTFALTPSFFNANDGVASAVDQRSDDKGPEPEGVVTGVVGGRTYAFVGLERAGGGVMMYDVTDPAAPRFVTYARKDGDVSPEGLVFVSAADSPNGRALLILSNEVSGTVTVYEIGRPPVINEFVIDRVGPDSNEFVEVLADPNADLSTYTLLLVEGDVEANRGVVKAAVPLTAANAAGFWTAGFANEQLDNGSGTLLLVRGYTGAAGVDLDANDDGVFDALPWAAVVDSAAVTDGGASDRAYSTVVLGPALAGGAARIPNGVDLDAAADWTANDVDGVGVAGEAANTPGTANRLIQPPTIVTFATSSPGGQAVEGQAVTVTGTFVDPDALGAYAVTVFWGDGTSSAATVNQAAGTFTATHVYGDAGFYDVVARLTDGDSASDDASAMAVIAGTSLRSGTLYVIGTDRADGILLHGQGRNRLRVRTDFRGPDRSETFDLAGISRILVFAGDGNDSVSTAGDLATPLWIDGGNGNDSLRGGAGPNLILGGAGNDLLLGGRSADVLIGGEGTDLLLGGAGSDLLIAGATAFDSDMTALGAILAEWTRTDRGYGARAAALRAGVGPGGTYALDATTVRDDERSDLLIGASGEDWFWAEPFDPTGGWDLIADRVLGEPVN